MTTADTTPAQEPVDITANYATFKETFNDPSKDVTPEPEAPEADIEEDTLANEEGKDAPDGDESEDPVEESDDEAEPEAEPKPEDKGKKAKPSARERINELTRLRYEESRGRIDAERKAFELEQRLAKLENPSRQSEEVTPQPQTQSRLPQGAPNPDATNKDGSAIYPLGEYDPKFIFDLTQFTVEQKTREMEDQRKVQLEQEKLVNERKVIVDKYHERLQAYEEEAPEVRENIAGLMTTFASIEPAYGEYLATTIMECENGPAIMDYLSQNIGEAQGIVASGPAAATRAIGRLEVRLMKEEKSDEQHVEVNTPGSPPPPPTPTRGSGKGRATVRPDTNDYSAFKRDFLSQLK